MSHSGSHSPSQPGPTRESSIGQKGEAAESKRLGMEQPHLDREESLLGGDRPVTGAGRERRLTVVHLRLKV